MKIGIIGCGNMGRSIAKRLAAEHQLFLYDHSQSKMKEVIQGTNGAICKNPQELVKEVEIVILSVKPKDLNAVADSIGKMFSANQLLISVLAGTSLQILKNFFLNVCIVRMMPNLAVAFGQGVVALSETDGCSDALKMQIEEVFSSLGLVKWIPEPMMDAIASLTGCGPAFTFVCIEAMVDAAISMGFSSSEGQKLVIQMMKGALAMLEESEKSPGELKWQVTSPAGMTIAGLRKMEAHSVRSGIMEAFIAAYERAYQIAKEKE